MTFICYCFYYLVMRAFHISIFDYTQALLRRTKLHVGIESARGDLARCDNEKLSNRSCVYTLRSIFSCANTLPGYYSLPLIIIARVCSLSFSLSLALFLLPSLCSSSWRIMKTVPRLRSSFRVSRAVITIASRKISPRGQGVPAAVVFSSFFVSLFRIVNYRALARGAGRGSCRASRTRKSRSYHYHLGRLPRRRVRTQPRR